MSRSFTLSSIPTLCYCVCSTPPNGRVCVCRTSLLWVSAYTEEHSQREYSYQSSCVCLKLDEHTHTSSPTLASGAQPPSLALLFDFCFPFAGPDTPWTKHKNITYCFRKRTVWKWRNICQVTLRMVLKDGVTLLAAFLILVWWATWALSGCPLIDLGWKMNKQRQQCSVYGMIYMVCERLLSNFPKFGVLSSRGRSMVEFQRLI